MRLVTTLCALSAMVLQAEPIGLVLSGGGARGAYEVGTIVVVYLDNERRLGQDRVWLGDFPGKRIVEIIPSQDTRGIVGSVDPRKMQARKLIDLGYCDACAVLESSRKEDSK